MQRITILDSSTQIEGWVVKDPLSKFWIVRIPHVVMFVPADAEYTFQMNETLEEVQEDMILFNHEWNHTVEVFIDGTITALYAWISGKRYIPSVLDVEETRVQLLRNRREE